MFRITSLIGIFLVALYALVPQLLEQPPSWMPSKKLVLGLDLRGGIHMLLSVDVEEYVVSELRELSSSIRALTSKSGLKSRIMVEDEKLLVSTPGQVDELVYLLGSNIGEEFDIENENGQVTVKYKKESRKALQKEIVDKTIKILSKRLDASGTTETVIQKSGQDKVLVQIPGIDNLSHIDNMIKKIAKLEFVLMKDNGQLDFNVSLSGKLLISSYMAYDKYGNPVVNFKLNQEGAKKFGKITTDHKGKKLAVVLDNKVVASPVINGPILGGVGEINGKFTFQEARELALMLSSGALPTSLHVVEERVIDAALGKGSIKAAQKAAITAFILVSTFMVWVYRIYGVWATVALFFNLMIIMSCMIFFQITLTFPGVAGLILTIGMAVDSNVLIFERIKEEAKKNKYNRIESIDVGFHKAFRTILDANITTLITALIMFFVSDGPVRGFSVALSIGILSSISSTVLVTRMLTKFRFSSLHSSYFL